MAKIIRLDETRKKLAARSSRDTTGCLHKSVTAYTAYRTVQCSTCGMELDPFDVLVDMLKGHIPPDNREEQRLNSESKRRKK